MGNGSTGHLHLAAKGGHKIERDAIGHPGKDEGCGEERDKTIGDTSPTLTSLG